MRKRRAPEAPESDKRRNDTRARLLDEALSLLVREGYEHATTGRIASAAGIRQSSFYSHFESRDACLAEAVTQEAERLIERLAGRRRALGPLNASQRVSREAVGAGFAMALSHLGERPELFTLIALREAEHPAGQAVRAALERLRDSLVADLGRFGIAPPPQATMRVELMMALTFQAVVGWRDGRYAFDEALAVLTDGAIALISPDAPRPST